MSSAKRSGATRTAPDGAVSFKAPGREAGDRSAKYRRSQPDPRPSAALFYSTLAAVHGFAQRSREMQRLGADNAQFMPFLFFANSDFLCIFAQILLLLGWS
jgi:hypothetical protein